MGQHVALCGQYNIDVIGDKSLVGPFDHFGTVFGCQLGGVLVVAGRDEGAGERRRRRVVGEWGFPLSRRQVVAVKQVKVLVKPSTLFLIHLKLIFLLLLLVAVIKIYRIHIENAQNAQQKHADISYIHPILLQKLKTLESQTSLFVSKLILAIFLVQQKPEAFHDPVKLRKIKLSPVYILIFCLILIFILRSYRGAGDTGKQLHTLQDVAELFDKLLSPIFLIILTPQPCPFFHGLFILLQAFQQIISTLGVLIQRTLNLLRSSIGVHF